MKISLKKRGSFFAFPDRFIISLFWDICVCSESVFLPAV